VRVAIVGLGTAAFHLHLPAITGIDGLVLVGGCDESPERRRAWEGKTHTPAFAGFEELLDATAPGTVVVATPPGSHADLCVAALLRSAHVICEKPLAPTVAEADRIVEAAAAAGRSVAVNHHFRFQPIFAAVAEAVAARRHGALVFVQAWQLMDLPPWREPAPWRAAMSDRCLLESGVHFVDLLLHLFGDRPDALSFHRSAGPGGPSGADAVQILTLEFPHGRLAQLTINRVSVAATRYAELRADCEDASLRASVGGRALLSVGKERAKRAGVRLDLGRTGLAWAEIGRRRTVLARNPARAEIVATRRLIEDSVAAFGAGTEPPAPADQARAAVAVIEAAYAHAPVALA